MRQQTLRIDIADSTQVSEARRAAQDLARLMGFDESEAGKVAIVTTEAATNLLKHANGGQMLIQPVDAETVDIAALDKGPGIDDLDRCLQDGYSTAGTLGGGLGAIRRLATQADIYTVMGKGTAISIQCSRGKQQQPSWIAGYCVPLKGQDVCGDSWGAIQQNGLRTVCVADGLGHGPLAATASRAAVETFLEHSHRPPAQLLECMHAALRPTRGAAAAVLQLDTSQSRALFAGVGNIAGVILRGAEARHMVSMNGTLGHEARYFREFEYRCDEESTVILHSDGIHTRWDLNSHPGILQRAPSVIASVLYRDFARPHDDATVVVIGR